MSCRSLPSATALSAVILIALVSQRPATGQAQSRMTKASPAGKAWTSPRTPDGRPDLQGIWSNATLTPLERPKGLGTKEFYTDEEFAKLATRVRQGDVGEEADRKSVV